MISTPMLAAIRQMLVFKVSSLSMLPMPLHHEMRPRKLTLLHPVVSTYVAADTGVTATKRTLDIEIKITDSFFRILFILLICLIFIYYHKLMKCLGLA